MKKITPTMWSVFELFYKTLKETAIDFMEEALPALDNYLSFGKDVFCQNAYMQEMILDIVNSVRDPFLVFKGSLIHVDF
jgi:hypothetical protein